MKKGRRARVVTRMVMRFLYQALPLQKEDTLFLNHLTIGMDLLTTILATHPQRYPAQQILSDMPVRSPPDAEAKVPVDLQGDLKACQMVLDALERVTFEYHDFTWRAALAWMTTTLDKMLGNTRGPPMRVVECWSSSEANGALLCAMSFQKNEKQ